MKLFEYISNFKIRKGYEWLSYAPSNWNIAPLKQVAGLVLGKMLQSQCPPGLKDVYTLEKYIKSKNITALGLSVESDNVDEMYFNPSEKKLYLLKVGDIVMNEGGDIGKVALWKPQDFDCYIQNSVHKITPYSDIKPAFLQYLIFAIASTGYFWSIVNKISIAHLTKDKIANTLIVYPTFAEQEAIASYLDKECEKIERRMKLLERKADAYRRLKRSIINRAVTHGLNPDVPMKPSGLRWIRNVPEHWNIGRVRNYFDYRNEKVSEIDFAPLSITKNGVVPQMENVAKSMAEGDSRKKVCKNDFVVNSRSDRKGSCGTASFDGSVSLIYIVLEPKTIDPEFTDYYFRCNDWVEEFYRNGKGIVADLWTTNYSIMRNIEIALPPISEQREIAAYLDEKCSKIDAIVDKIGTQIERLKELKRSLINEVVTGRRAVISDVK
ncbi:MAG: restriction endonuclease subunit S [Odoribacter sp.]|nr:restriction endonuclease subunit S [Odoribacter sp.]